MLSYAHPIGVSLVQRQRPLLTLPEGGAVAIDERVLELWRLAEGRTLEHVLRQTRGLEPNVVRAALACLAEGGLLERVPPPPMSASMPLVSGPLVSAIIVITSEKEADWLNGVLASLATQTYSPIEAVVIDNATPFSLADRLKPRHLKPHLIRLSHTNPLSAAINYAISHTRGDYLLILNPDIVLDRNAVAELAAIAAADESCAAVACKLMFLRAPAFLNGLGNRVRDFTWGTDNAIGQLDLGQFEHWREVPSACFAATLIPRKFWDIVGEVDEGYFIYYEDTDWSYRARLLGYTVRAAPRATVKHLFGGFWESDKSEEGLPSRKLRRVCYSRLRFALKIVSADSLARFIGNYWREDVANLKDAVRQRKWDVFSAYLTAWRDIILAWPKLWVLRRAWQRMRVCSDAKLFPPEQTMPPTFEWRGLPELTWEHIANYYWPLMRAGQTRALPELEDMTPTLGDIPSDGQGNKYESNS